MKRITARCSEGMEESEYEDEDDNGLPSYAHEKQDSIAGDEDDNGVEMRKKDKWEELYTEPKNSERNEAEIKAVEVNLPEGIVIVDDKKDDENDNDENPVPSSDEYSLETTKEHKDFGGIEIKSKDLKEHEGKKEGHGNGGKGKVEKEQTPQNIVTGFDAINLESTCNENNRKADEHNAIKLEDTFEKKLHILKDDKENEMPAESENGRTIEDEAVKSNSEEEAPTEEKTDDTNSTCDGSKSCIGSFPLKQDTGQVRADKEETETTCEEVGVEDENVPEESWNSAKTTQHGNMAANRSGIFSNFNCILSVVVIAIIGQFQGVGGTLTVFPQTVLVRSNDTVRLPCSTDLSGVVFWERVPFGSAHQQTVYAGINGGLNNVDTTRFSIDKSEKDGRYDIVIRNVQSDDAGTYICIDQEGFGEKKSIELVVIENFACKMVIPPDGFMGENVFGLEENNIRASCVFESRGNHNPLFVWKWNNTGNKLNSINSTEGSLMKSEVTIRPTKQLNGAQLFFTLSLNSSESEPQWRAITWTWDPLKVNYATLETAAVEVCRGSRVIPVCNPECAYREDQEEDGQCRCIATYEVHGQRKSITFNKYVCDPKDAVRTVVLPLLIIVSIAALAAVIFTVMYVVVRRRKSKHRKSKTVSSNVESYRSNDTEQLKQDQIVETANLIENKTSSSNSVDTESSRTSSD